MNADAERYFSDLIEAKKFNGYTLVSVLSASIAALVL